MTETEPSPTEIIPTSTPGIEVWRWTSDDAYEWVLTHAASGKRLSLPATVAPWPGRSRSIFNRLDVPLAMAEALGEFDVDWTVAEGGFPKDLELIRSMGDVAQMLSWPTWSKELEAELLTYPVILAADVAMVGVMDDVASMPCWSSPWTDDGDFAHGAHIGLRGGNILEYVGIFYKDMPEHVASMVQGHRFGSCIVARALGRAEDGHLAHIDDHPPSLGVEWLIPHDHVLPAVEEA